jgi:hypothetical protein
MRLLKLRSTVEAYALKTGGQKQLKLKKLRSSMGSYFSLTQGHSMKKGLVFAGLFVVIAGLVGFFLFRGGPTKESTVYVIQMEGPKGTGYFQDLAPELKLTDDMSKAKRFDKKDGEVWFTAIQQKMAINHTPPSVRKAVKLIGVD